MSIDLRTEKTSGTWVARFGDHEAAGFMISINDVSAHVTLISLMIMFRVDRRDVPAAWDETIDVIKLRAELLAAIVRHMSTEVLEILFGEIHSQRQHAFMDGEQEARLKIRVALGL